jgi:UV DNA damage endonuclease
MRLGYCCINLTLRAKKPSVYTGRTLIRRLFTMQKASERAAQNTEDLLAILRWNLERDIRIFRITSDLFPRMTDPENGYRVIDLVDGRAIIKRLRAIGKFAAMNRMQLSFHPGPFALFGSPDEKASAAGIKEVEAHALIAEYICEGAKLDIPINIHVGGSYQGDFGGTAKRWLKNFRKLSKGARERLALENDDRPGGWSIRKLYYYIHGQTGVPLTIDLHHFLFCNNGYPMEDDYFLAKSTWGKRSNQVHYSESPGRKLIPAHSDYLKHPLPGFVLKDAGAHVLLEAKAKELALLKYRRQFRIRESDH